MISRKRFYQVCANFGEGLLAAFPSEDLRETFLHLVNADPNSEAGEYLNDIRTKLLFRGGWMEIQPHDASDDDTGFLVFSLRGDISPDEVYSSYLEDSGQENWIITDFLGNILYTEK